MRYRADIDGLRAVAVMAVVLFHVGVPGFAGGFVGVDVFFVISGYLICGLIHAHLRDGTFSLADFYKRRILRIVPALAVMMLVTSVAAAFVLLPMELNDYAASVVAAALSVSNLYFAKTAGYFDAPALTKPMLHTWSLSVEEQFYLVAPFLFMLARRFRPTRLVLILGITALASLGLAILVEARNPTFAFYLAPCRAWQLLLGALISTGSLPRMTGGRGAGAAGGLGLAMILGAVLLGSGDRPLILMTGLATLGAALVIASSEVTPSPIGRMLGVRPLVFIGTISYSLYLWHWPVIVFGGSAAPLSGSLPPGSAKAAMVAVSVALAILSWRFVETPFRAMTWKTSRAAVFGGFAAATVVLGGYGLLVMRLDGLPFRFPDRVVRLAAYLGYDPAGPFRMGRCYLATNRQSFDAARCLETRPDRPNYLLLGDSHAAHLWLGLSQAMPQVNLMQATASMCRPLLGQGSALETGFCPQLRRLVFDRFLAETPVDTVILSAAWKDGDVAGLSATFAALRARGVTVVLLGPIVEYDEPLPRLLANGILRGDPDLARRMRNPAIPRREAAFRALAAAEGVAYVSVYDAACPGGTCETFVGAEVPLQFDAGHLTAEGSILVARRLVDRTGLGQPGRTVALRESR